MALRKKAIDDSQSSGEVVAKLDSIERLLMILLAKLGADSKEIASGLGVDSSTIRKRIPFRKIEKLSIASSSGTP